MARLAETGAEYSRSAPGIVSQVLPRTIEDARSARTGVPRTDLHRPMIYQPPYTTVYGGVLKMRHFVVLF